MLYSSFYYLSTLLIIRVCGFNSCPIIVLCNHYGTKPGHVIVSAIKSNRLVESDPNNHLIRSLVAKIEMGCGIVEGAVDPAPQFRPAQGKLRCRGGDVDKVLVVDVVGADGVTVAVGEKL